ncbi:MAG: cyclic nucleotide-binding domain-containing protein [Candidatus Cloacimonetes bacterium]|nr:cyclic nucleotide-binding domain-containing protein [Candidatus Cloacimonadota bacterium]
MIKQYLSWLKSFFTRPDRYPHLRGFSLLENFSTFELYLLNNMLYKRNYKAGEMLYDKDYPLEAVYFIIKGEVEVLHSAGGFQHKTLTGNEFLGIIDMYHESLRSSSAQAKTAVETYVISTHDLEELIRLNPKLGVKFLGNSCRFLSAYIFEMTKIAVTGA